MKVFAAIFILVGCLSSVVGARELFRKLDPESSRVHFIHPFEENCPQAHLYYSGTAVGGMCLGDVDGDSLLDLYVVGAAGQNGLWLNSGGMRFVASELPEALTGENKWGTGAAMVDIDNDGDLDLYQCNYDARNQLFLNDGKGRFTELKDAAGLACLDASMQVSFADVDNDGDLDMFLLCNAYFSPTGAPSKLPVSKKGGVPQILPEYRKYYKLRVSDQGKYKVTEYGRHDYLFLNESKDGKLAFRDVSRESGIGMEGYGLSSVWWDYDSDGDLDLYVANDFVTPDRLFRNDGVRGNGVPKFVNAIVNVLPHTPWSTMGSDVADINHDGLPDLISTDMAATTHYMAKTGMGALTKSRRDVLTSSSPRQYMRNHLLINTGFGFFQEMANISGLSSTNWSWTAKFGDLDNDGFQDLFVSNGISRDFMNADREARLGGRGKAIIGKSIWELNNDAPPRLEKNIVFQNLDGKQFKKRLDWGLGLLGMSYSSAMGDLDNDGDLDLVVSDLGKNVKIYQNQGTSHKSLRVKLAGVKSNRMGIGARVVVTDSEGVKRTRWMNPWTGYQSQNDTVLHFGIGDAKVATVEVYWPSGIYQNLPMDELGSIKGAVQIVEKSSGKPAPPQKSKPIFRASEAPNFQHKEKEYDDFKRQPLIPQKLTQLGPCLAKGDIDGDGDEDFFVGGAQNQAGALFLNEGGKFTQSNQAAFNGLAKYAEDSASIMFDADGDGDLDLLVVTGSTEYEPDDTLYKDRLYLNTIKGGKPILEPAPDAAFPFLLDSGSCVVAADYDGDGDIDLFIGSRSIPGKYPLVPVSRLVRNDSTQGSIKFTDVSDKELKIDHMVTDAVWADLDQDGDPELCVATDWGPVTIFKNNQGKLENVSASAGTGIYSGWWRSIHAVDVDMDGDLDLVVGNTGTNTKYKHPSDKYPAILYYGDLDGSGKQSIVEAKIQKDKDQPLPVRGRY